MAVFSFRRILPGLTVFAVALLIAGALCVPLSISCFSLGLDSPISVEQVALINRAGLLVLLLYLVVQPLAGSILRRGLFPTSTGQRKLLQFIGITAVCTTASIGIGALIEWRAEERWHRVALMLSQFM